MVSWGPLEIHRREFDAFDKAISLNDSDPAEKNIRGVALAKIGRYDEAITSFDSAIADPAYKSRNNKGVTQYHLNRTDDALASFDRAIGLNPSLAVFFSNKAYALLQKKDYPAIIEVSRLSMMLDMTNVPSGLLQVMHLMPRRTIMMHSMLMMEAGADIKR